MESWFNDYGVVTAERLEEFESIRRRFRDILKGLEGHISYKEMYWFAEQAAGGAVADLVCTRVISRQLGEEPSGE